jgi:hypothetical protein
VTGSCSTCHNLPGDHISTGAQCNECHNTSSWEDASFDHDSVTGFCADCHASEYRDEKHKKFSSPYTEYYTVNELRDCAGACHEYTNSSMTTIKKFRSGEHSTTDEHF